MAKVPESAIPKIPIYLKQARIENHAPLQNSKVKFKPGLNIIIGPNGVGKTRFMNLVSQSIDWFGSPKIGIGCELILGYDKEIKISFRQPLSLEEEKTNFRIDKPATLKVDVAYRSKKASAAELFEAMWEVGVKSVIYEPILAKHGTPLQHLPLVDLPASITFGESFGMRIETRGNLIPTRMPLLANSIFSTLSRSFSRRRIYLGQKKISLSLSSEDVHTEIDRVVKGYLDFLNPVLATYSPIKKIRLSPSHQTYENYIQQEILVKNLLFEYFIFEQWLPFEALSDGTKRMLYIISQLVMPEVEFVNDSTIPAQFSLFTPHRIIFLEEPELGIHHSQLHKLLQLIREISSESQIILTTHAPQVLDMLGADELDRITICSLDSKKGTQFHKLTEEKQEQARVYMKEVGFLSDYWRYSYLEETEAE